MRLKFRNTIMNIYSRVIGFLAIVILVSATGCQTSTKRTKASEDGIELDELFSEVKKTTYQTDGEWITGNNINRYNNRPLYINNTDGLILAGDKPLIRFLKNQDLFGNLIIVVEQEDLSVRLDDFEFNKSFFAPGQVKWILNDSRFKNLEIHLKVLPTASGIGMVVQLETINLHDGVSLHWYFGGSKQYPRKNLAKEFDIMGHPGLMTWSDIGNALENPAFQGEFTASSSNDHTLAFELNANNKVISQTGDEAKRAYTKAIEKLDDLVGRMTINTPDPYLNVIAKTSLIAVDATWYPPVFVHAAMTWNVPLPGWRTIFGGTMYGWHDRVQEQAKYYIASQVKESNKTAAKADPKSLLTEQHPDSRFYGKGRIMQDQKFYNMQSQFFDQLIQEYRWTNDPELLHVLRESLELHLEWLRDCFDPDGDGTYESYLNSWPSDSQWYNGGGTAEETSYAYRGHLAARDMARNAGDKETEKFHNQMLEKIKKGFFEKLWINDKGHSGAYREQGGHKRLHEDPWVYSIFLPIDAGLTSQLQSVESVYYTEWALQNDTIPLGGRQVWSSNWVPGIWSVRERWPGDNYHLALSYFQAGLGNDAWDIFRGTYTHTAFNHNVPGNLGGHQGGTDFGDCVHPFSRTLVEGLFGFQPDYPNGKVIINPYFPSEWDYATLELPDFKIDFKRDGTTSKYEFELARESDMVLKLPVRSKGIKNVTVNGKRTQWELKPGVGCSVVEVEIMKGTSVTITIEHEKTIPANHPIFLEGNVGEEIRLTALDAKIVSFEDPQEILLNENLEEGKLDATLANKKGYHTVLAQVLAGDAPQYRVYRIKINDPKGDAQGADRFLMEVPETANWETIDISSEYNSDVTTIYKQHYLSPRPNTVSARLGSDGYSPWTFWHWKSTPPEIKTDNVVSMLDKENMLITPQGVPFVWTTGDKNITFTSMWDNFPKKVEFPINKTGNAIYFLVSGSTNVMQCNIANAVIHLNYEDGKTESLELIPPVNYWNLSTITANATAPGQQSRNDYLSETDAFCLPEKLPETVQLGENCRAMLLNLKLRKDIELESITLETLSQEVVVGLIGVTVMKQQ